MVQYLCGKGNSGKPASLTVFMAILNMKRFSEEVACYGIKMNKIHKITIKLKGIHNSNLK
jgi:hypothetical protein